MKVYGRQYRYEAAVEAIREAGFRVTKMDTAMGGWLIYSNGQTVLEVEADKKIIEGIMKNFQENMSDF